MRKAIAIPALGVACVLAAALATPAIVGREAKKKAEEAGYALEMRETKVRAGKVYLLDVHLTGRGIDMRAKEVLAAFDWHLRPTAVTATGADVTVQREKAIEGGRTETGKSRRPEILLENAKVRVDEKGVKAEARVKTARLDPAGRIWATADVDLSRGRTSVSVVGLKAEGVQPGSETEMKAKSVVIRQSEGEEEAASGDGGERKMIPLVTLETEVLKFESPWLQAEAEDVEIGVSRTKTGEKLSFLAMYVRSSGARASGVSVYVERSESEPGTAVRVEAETVETEDRRLSSAEFALERVDIAATVERRKTGVIVRLGSAKLGSAKATFQADLTPTEFRASIEMPEVDCDQALHSLPKAIVPRLQEAELKGTIQWRAEAYVDLPSRKKPDISMWMKNKCVVKKVPEDLDVKLLRKPFWREVYSAGGERKRELAGPGTPAWTGLAAISPYMPMAVMATEDPAFMSHRGILLQAIENSMEQNITAGKFVRGGSTISMQLAKNLWLAREKTISRKVQEAVLTTYLEQSLTKAQMLELYLNIVEFGPNLYGIGPASRKYFAKDPSTLTLSQSLFLASLLPSPKSAGYEEGKQVSSGRLGFLRKVMKMMLDRGTINEPQYQQGLKETPVFGEPSPLGGTEELTSSTEGIDPSEWR